VRTYRLEPQPLESGRALDGAQRALWERAASINSTVSAGTEEEMK